MAVKDTLLAVSGLLGGNSGGGGSTIITKTITANGTYAASSDNADGYSEVTVNVAGEPFADGADIVGFTLDGATLIKDVVVDLSGKQWKPIQGWLKATATNDNTTVTIKAKKMTNATPAPQCATSAKIRTLVFDMEEPPHAGAQFMRNNSIYRVLGTPVLYTEFGSGTYTMLSSTNLMEIYLVPNKVTSGGAGITVSSNFLDASLVSVANALQEGLATAQTFKINTAAVKAKCDTIMGTVSTVTEDDVTYHMFTQDPNGTVTLAEFITNTKGWTLA